MPQVQYIHLPIDGAKGLCTSDLNSMIRTLMSEYGVSENDHRLVNAWKNATEPATTEELTLYMRMLY